MSSPAEVDSLSASCWDQSRGTDQYTYVAFVFKWYANRSFEISRKESRQDNSFTISDGE